MLIPNNFDGERFAKKFNISVDDFYAIGGELICPSMPDLTDADLLDCVVDLWLPVRVKRDALLQACDWTQIPDAVLTGSEKAAWLSYRQTLRDIPQNFAAPEDVVYPELPTGVG